ncbi:hypothetical protein BF93_09440 [Brachybacterium phenoliresistens]|uniref:DUF202 domain-containing protein n=1 Tax=Brachybacterium phenoliresistens TaxID=396014 RepID=Z9JNM7_9MICO|nr:DUF202 domain-containing protein [Brachybacterium phenoliresistens]EWS79789.1 hypothetical protein BF93_09440 [Brachybacterium phenoliresistens]
MSTPPAGPTPPAPPPGPPGPPPGGPPGRPRRPGDAPFDPGLQVERTLLAWRRTCLSFAAAGLVAARFTAPALGVTAVVAGLAVAGCAILAYVATAHGYAREHRGLVEEDGLARSGVPMLVATGAVLLLGALCAAYLVAGILRS